MLSRQSSHSTTRRHLHAPMPKRRTTVTMWIATCTARGWKKSMQQFWCLVSARGRLCVRGVIVVTTKKRLNRFFIRMNYLSIYMSKVKWLHVRQTLYYTLERMTFVTTSRCEVPCGNLMGIYDEWTLKTTWLGESQYTIPFCIVDNNEKTSRRHRLLDAVFGWAYARFVLLSWVSLLRSQISNSLV